MTGIPLVVLTWLRRKGRAEEGAARKRYAVLLQHDFNFWTVEFEHRWQWPCRLMVWLHTRCVSGRFRGENVYVDDREAVA